MAQPPNDDNNVQKKPSNKHVIDNICYWLSIMQIFGQSVSLSTKYPCLENNQLSHFKNRTTFCLWFTQPPGFPIVVYIFQSGSSNFVCSQSSNGKSPIVMFIAMKVVKFDAWAQRVDVDIWFAHVKRQLQVRIITQALEINYGLARKVGRCYCTCTNCTLFNTSFLN